MDTKEKEENVLNFPKQDYAVFSDNIKAKIKKEVVSIYGDEIGLPDELVNGLENALCQAIVKTTRKVFTKMGVDAANFFKNNS